jgi:hypothetical protein
MANTLGNPTFVSTLLREDVVIATNTRLAANTTIANPILRIRNSTTTLVDYPLNATTPLTVGASDGTATVNPTSPNAVASGGSATLADNYQILGRDNTVHLSGPFSASTDAYTAGQGTTLGSTTITMPAS